MDVIFLHGLGQSSSAWKETVSYLPEGTKAHCPDLFDFSADRAMTYQNTYSALEGYLARFPGAVTLCGLSLGAVLALNYAILHAEKVQSLILIAPRHKMPRLLLKFQNTLFRCMPEKAFSQSGTSKRDVIRLTSSMMTLNLGQRLSSVSCPTLITCGRNDFANRAAAKKLAAKIPTAKLLFMEKAGHEVNVTAPEKLAQVMDRFFRHAAF